MRRRYVAPVVLLGVVLLAAVAGPIARTVKRLVWPELRAYESIRFGITEHEVRARLGEPFRTYTRETAPKNYYLPSYGYEERQITNKVLIYVTSEPILYVYLDSRSRVEDVVLGGT